jgi:ribosome-binding protein aMBF1 (putative translation factor)
MTIVERNDGDVRIETANPSRAGISLDEHHVAETNGRMSVCRRCGVQTDSPQGKHNPHARQFAKAQAWLDAEAMSSRIARMKSERDT